MASLINRACELDVNNMIAMYEKSSKLNASAAMTIFDNQVQIHSLRKSITLIR